jgi:hypothetical protein
LIMMKDAVLRILSQSFERLLGFSPSPQGQLCIGTFSERMTNDKLARMIYERIRICFLRMMAECAYVQRFSPFPIVKTINPNERGCQPYVGGRHFLVLQLCVTVIA